MLYMGTHTLNTQARKRFKLAGVMYCMLVVQPQRIQGIHTMYSSWKSSHKRQ